jgi:sigma-B regulation protein RsbU (phosphoserine phosphatase)
VAAGSGIVPVRGPRTYYVAAEPSRVSARLVRTLLQPLSASVLERYSELLGCDVVVDPAPRWTVRSEIGGGVVVGADRSWSLWPDAPAVTTVAAGGEHGLLRQSLYHGISDLQLSAGGEGRTRIVALIMVRTSLADLASALYSTGGMNTAVVLLLLILASLILAAVLFSSYLGFSLGRSITASVAALRRGAQRLGDGDLDARIELKTRDELATLAASFNRMASDLKQMIREVARRERLEKEVQIAREIQVNMLPQELPSPEGYQVAGASHPATEVAGDYYDSVLLAGGRLAVVVADVSGKGVAAAMLMSNLQASLHVLLHQQRSLDDVIERLNVLIHRNSTPDMFITLFVGVIDLRSGTMEYVNSGHDPPILVKRDGSVDLASTGLLLGFMPEAKYQVASAVLEPGDCLVMYSDGVTEAMNAAEEEFGRDRLVETLRGLGECDAQTVVATVTQRVHDHVGPEAVPGDDLTLLVLKSALR